MRISYGKIWLYGGKACWVMLFLFCFQPVFSQERGDPELQKVTAKEWNLEFFINTSGFGMGFQSGRTPNYYDKHFWEIDFLYNKHQKAVRGRNPVYAGASAYSYGKLYDLFFLRAGYGYQRTLNQKPYWGGVKVRYTLSGGFSLGMAVPVYLYVIDSNLQEVAQRYDPDIHDLSNIVGRGPFLKGIGQTALRPGFYVKTGMNFDFSKNENFIHALEVGLTVDMVFPFIQQMAYNKAKPLYFCAYLAYDFGKRKGVYEK